MSSEEIIDKPDWLSKIERQSFEVELIVSGLAIYGSLYLGTFLHEASESLVFQFSDNVLFLLKFVFLYLFVAQKILLLSFITHFALRVLWIGMIGLNSVYPDGINLNSRAYPEHILQKAKEEYPSVTDYSLKLDRTCSVIFSILCAAIIVFVVIAIWLFIAIGISELLRTFLSDSIVYGIQVSVFTLFYIVVIALGLLTTIGPYVGSDLSKKYAYKILSGLNRGFFLMFHEPFAYISYTLRTNSSKVKFVMASILICFISVVLSFNDLSKTFNIYKKEAFFEQNQTETGIFNRNYLDTHDGNYLLYPTIQSEVIKDGYLKLFIPEYTRERKSREMICGAFVPDEKNTDLQNRIARDNYHEECAMSYYTLIIDKGRLDNIQFKHRRHNSKLQWGYQAIIPVSSLSEGEHQLKIKMAYKNEDGQSITRIIPFYKL